MVWSTDSCADFSTNRTISAKATTSSLSYEADAEDSNKMKWIGTASDYSGKKLEGGSYTIIAFIDTATADEQPEGSEPYNCASGFQLASDNAGTTQSLDIVKTLSEF